MPCLSDSDKIAILRTTGLTKAQAQAKLAQMGLTQSTQAQTTANASATASTFSLTAAVKGFGASLKAACLLSVFKLIMDKSLPNASHTTSARAI